MLFLVSLFKTNQISVNIPRQNSIHKYIIDGNKLEMLLAALLPKT